MIMINDNKSKMKNTEIISSSKTQVAITTAVKQHYNNINNNKGYWGNPTKDASLHDAKEEEKNTLIKFKR